MSNSAATTSLTGVDKLWVKARRNNYCFMTNKFLSVVLAGSLAAYTASQKSDIIAYSKEYPGADNVNTYNFCYWLLFIYYSFSALDELIELYAVYFEREKGALGLLLEMNNFLGMAVVLYLTIFSYKDSANLPEKYQHLHHWVNYQVVWMYVSIGLSMLMVGCFAHMQSKVVRKEDETSKTK